MTFLFEKTEKALSADYTFCSPCSPLLQLPHKSILSRQLPVIILTDWISNNIRVFYRNITFVGSKLLDQPLILWVKFATRQIDRN